MPNTPAKKKKPRPAIAAPMSKKRAAEAVAALKMQAKKKAAAKKAPAKKTIYNKAPKKPVMRARKSVVGKKVKF